MSTAHISQCHRKNFSMQFQPAGNFGSVDPNAAFMNPQTFNHCQKLPTPQCVPVYPNTTWGSVSSVSPNLWNQSQQPLNSHWMYYGMTRNDPLYFEQIQNHTRTQYQYQNPNQNLPPVGLNVYNTNSIPMYQTMQNGHPMMYLSDSQKYPQNQVNQVSQMPTMIAGPQVPQVPQVKITQPQQTQMNHVQQISQVHLSQMYNPQHIPLMSNGAQVGVAQPPQPAQYGYPVFNSMNSQGFYQKQPTQYPVYGKSQVVSATYAPSQAYQDISSPSSTFLDAEYDVPLASKFITTVANNISPRFKLSISEISNFESFVKNILCATHLSKSTMILSLVYLTRFVKHAELPFGISLKSLMSGSFILANKSNDDNTFTNSSWSSVTGISPSEITSLELKLLDIVNWRLTLDNDGLSEWSYWNDCWQQYSANMKSGYPPSPVSPKNWNYGMNFGSVAVC